MIFHNTKLINLGETEVSLFLFVLLVVSFSSPRDADNLSLRFENVCISRRGLLFYCTSFWNLHISSNCCSPLGGNEKCICRLSILSSLRLISPLFSTEVMIFEVFEGVYCTIRFISA